MIWSAWRYREIQKGRATERASRQHVARFVLVGLYTGTRSGAICNAALTPAIGRGFIDLENGVFYRRALGAVWAFLQSLDVLSVPTTYREPKGLYVLEAWANGVPVVQPRHGSFPELMEAAGGGLLDRFPDRPHGKFLTDADFEVFVTAYKKSGFRGGLNWYRCMDRSWEESAGQTDRIEQPALMITAELDVVLRPEMAEGMKTWVPNLRKTVLVKGSGHWTQQEKPAEVNAAILDFLSDLKK